MPVFKLNIALLFRLLFWVIKGGLFASLYIFLKVYNNHMSTSNGDFVLGQYRIGDCKIMQANR